MIKTLPLLFTVLHLGQIGFTPALTFILLLPPCYSAFRQIVWTHFKFNFVTSNNRDAIHSKFAADVARNNVPIYEFNFEFAAW